MDSRKRFIQVYTDYCDREGFETDELSENDNEFGVMFTTDGEDYLTDEAGNIIGCVEDHLQATYFLDQLALIYFVNDEEVARETFNSIDEMADDLEDASWDAFYSLCFRHGCKAGALRTED